MKLFNKNLESSKRNVNYYNGLIEKYKKWEQYQWAIDAIEKWRKSVLLWEKNVLDWEKNVSDIQKKINDKNKKINDLKEKIAPLYVSQESLTRWPLKDEKNPKETRWKFNTYSKSQLQLIQLKEYVII